ncbi:MAG: alginate export family protein [Gammaproteobacteria bacterium]|nr:alginate export family protein [Gammaproteobacteria bacterium]
MQNLFKIFILWAVISLNPVFADDGNALDYEFSISIESSELDNLTLGDEPDEDRLEIDEIEFEFDLYYQINDQWYAFFAGALIDEMETIEPAGIKEEDVSALERVEMGVGYFFGNEIETDLNLGRMEFASASEWWLWWDEELDGVRLQSYYGNFELMLGLTEEQARENTDEDFIDPEVEDVQRLLASLGWEFADNQSLHFYYLDQQDDSSVFVDGQTLDTDKEDEEDADLTWTGFGYLGEFDSDTLGEFDIELHYAHVSGDETVTEFEDEDLPKGRSEVDGDPEKSRVSGDAHSFMLNWSPTFADDWSLVIGRAQGERDFRQTGLQGDSEVFGELYQPEISNLIVDVIGIEWEAWDGIEIALLSFDYEQDKLAGETRDTSIELDREDDELISRDLGRELDLVVTFNIIERLEIILIAAEFDAGRAYGEFSDETSDFWKIELEYIF